MTVHTYSTDDVDEAMAIFGQRFHDHRITATRNSPLGFRMTTAMVDTLSTGIVSYGQEITAESSGPRSYVAVPLRGAFNFRFGRVSVVADPVTAVIGSENRPATLRAWSEGDESLFGLSLDPHVMRNHLRSLVGREPIGPIQFTPSLNLRSGPGAQWWQMTSIIVLALQSSDSLAINPMLSAQLSTAVMTGLLLAAEHPYREALDSWTQPIHPRMVQRAMAYIDEHAHEPLTVIDVAAEVGCGVRALQLSFRRHLNTTPTEYIRRTRMDRVHNMLSFANPETATVAEIAQSWGFSQLGRFAAQYREIYGVSPNVTLRGD